MPSSEIISDTAKASIILETVSVPEQVALTIMDSPVDLVFSANQSLDIINRDTGYINYFLSSNA